MKIKDLVKDLNYTLLQGDLEKEVTGISHDNRSVESGDLFICITGARFDTHHLTKEIAKKGAVCFVTERPVEALEGVTVILTEDTRKASPILAAAFYGNPAEKLVTVGITGSKGKTTTTHMMADILRCAGYKTGTIGTNGAIIPGSTKNLQPSNIYGADQAKPVDCAETPGYLCYELANTTPDAMEIQRYLAMMVEAGCTHAVIEVSSQGEKQHRTDGFVFDYGIWTNIETGDHIGPNEHKDFEEYLYCKALLLHQSRIGFVNQDDIHAGEYLACVEKMRQTKEGVKGFPNKIYTYGCQEGADYCGTPAKKVFDEGTGQPGIFFQVSGKWDTDISVNLPGEFNEYNALPAIGAAHCMGISKEAVSQALRHLKIRGRFDIVFNNGHFQVCVDFAHNGYSTRNHLKALREYHPKRLVCVFGADGNRSRYRRYEMGEASALLADLSIVTAGHNRWESFEQILTDIEKGIQKAKETRKEPVSYLVIPKRQDAIRYAIEHAQEGDMITILGLGHESYQEENGVKYPHSDIAFVKECCRNL